jgi:hypothetical protein
MMMVNEKKALFFNKPANRNDTLTRRTHKLPVWKLGRSLFVS